ncbi:MAG: hypothetical protein LBU32_26970 [Clostridiales bacterium]|nr:hypothetical protein [Clostridiales bacterium]
MKISAGEFAKAPGISDFSLAEAKKPECRAYRCEGRLNGIESSAILLPFPKESFGKPAALMERALVRGMRPRKYCRSSDRR